MNDTETFRYKNGSPETLKRYGFNKINDRTFVWMLNDKMTAFLSLDTQTQKVTWYKGAQPEDNMIEALVQDMLNEEVIENYYEDDESAEVEFDDTMVCAACGEEPNSDTNYCNHCEEYVEPVPRGSL